MSIKNVKAVLTKIRKVIKGNKQTTPGELIKKLNPIISWWTYNYRHVVSKKTFKSVDSAIFKAIWRWCQRRHPNKGKRWIKKKYFKTIGNRKWVLHGIIEGRGGKEQEITLFSASRVPIKRHTKVRSKANPYDPKWARTKSDRVTKWQTRQREPNYSETYGKGRTVSAPNVINSSR